MIRDPLKNDIGYRELHVADDIDSLASKANLVKKLNKTSLTYGTEINTEKTTHTIKNIEIGLSTMMEDGG